MRIAIGSDHAGFRLKQALLDDLLRSDQTVTDFGTYSSESVDYPDLAAQVAGAVAAGSYDFGILICATGIGMSIAANKVPGVRAGLCVSPEQGRLTREHNDANVLCLGQRQVDAPTASAIVRAFLGAGFEGGRHGRRVQKIRDLEGAVVRSSSGGSPALNRRAES